MSTYKNDPCTDLILDFIAGGVPGNPSGESGGNYNAVIGEIHASDDLGKKALSEIYTLMAVLLARGRPSSAVGRYQIIRKTLATLQSSKGLGSDALFTPKLQDSLALSLMVGRGYQKWWAGQMSDADFAHGLSCEWASLPDPRNGGASHYDGVGPNHASTTLPHVMDMLSRARAMRKPVPAEPLVAAAPEASNVTTATSGVIGWVKGLFG